MAVLAFAIAACTVSCKTVHETRRPPEPGAFQRNGAIRLEVATSRTTHRVGDLFEFTAVPSADFPLTVLVRGANGAMRPIFPNPHAGDRLFRGGQVARFPGSGDFQLRISPPTGRETLIVHASAPPSDYTGEIPAESTWLKDAAPGHAKTSERRGEARVVYEVTP